MQTEYCSNSYCKLVRICFYRPLENSVVKFRGVITEAIDVVQIDSCRLAGVSEVLAVLLMAAK